MPHAPGMDFAGELSEDAAMYVELLVAAAREIPLILGASDVDCCLPWAEELADIYDSRTCSTKKLKRVVREALHWCKGG